MLATRTIITPFIVTMLGTIFHSFYLIMDIFNLLFYTINCFNKFPLSIKATVGAIRKDQVLGASSSKMSCLCHLDGQSTSRSVAESTISIITPRLRTGRIRLRRKAYPRDGRESSLPNTASIMSSEWIWKRISLTIVKSWRTHRKISRLSVSAILRARRSTNIRVIHTRCKRRGSYRHRGTLTFTLTASWCRPILISMRRYHTGYMCTVGPR